MEFTRAWAERVYGVPPEQVIGTTFATQFELKDGTTLSASWVSCITRTAIVSRRTTAPRDWR